MNLQRLPLCIAIACSGFVSSHAQTTVSTDPVGFVTVTIKASTTPGVATTTPLSPVMLVLSGVDGATTGKISSLSSNTLTLDSANWTASQLPSSRAYVLFKSGALEGLILRVTANTSSTVTLDTLAADLTNLGAVVGDSFQLVQGDTLASIFDSNEDGVPEGVIGGSQSDFQNNLTDRVTTRDASGQTRTYYYNTQFSQWRRLGSSVNQGNTPISPLSSVFYSRIGNTAVSHTMTGNVPVTAVKYLVPTTGITYLSRFYPSGGTIGDFGVQTLPGWKGTNTPGVTISSADKLVTTDAAGGTRQYYWTGTQWRRQGSSLNQSTVPVPIGGAVYVNRTGSTGPAQLLSVALPYAL